ncbi:hypothetical protein EVJ58_g4325 [Rhodofomes roseus]|uniref:Uncharacterized protein n=1 Tax=Rhodofomes roseus TaxID=34475 RepID=A0A4Y9YLB3_9APHY|nr:hypothetical protein EVJ58_g4325 [Rhodofomes roseus]
MSSQSTASGDSTVPWEVIYVDVVFVACVLGHAVSSQMPKRQIKELDEILDDTRSLLEMVIESGRLHDPQYIAETYKALRIMERHALDLKILTYRAGTPLQQLRAIIFGLLYDIYRLQNRAKNLRVNIAKSVPIEQYQSDVENNLQAPEKGPLV